MEEYFRKIIIILRKYYGIQLIGEYNVKVYVNKFYGLIIELERIDDNNPFLTNLIDMKIIFHINSIILYEVDNYDFIDYIKGNIKKYYYKNKFYFLINEIDDISYLKLLEYSKIIYGDKVKRIMGEALIIK